MALVSTRKSDFHFSSTYRGLAYSDFSQQLSHVQLLKEIRVLVSLVKPIRQNQDFGRRKISKFGENLDLDQIDGAEFNFLGPETRFERNKTNQILEIEIKILGPKSKFGAGQACSNL